MITRIVPITLLRSLLRPWLVTLTVGIGEAALAQRVPPPVALPDLTVPPDRLPDGCGLKAIEPAHQEVIGPSKLGGRTIRVTPATRSMQPEGVTANPWTGTDRNILASLRQRVDGYGMVRWPDAPPLTRREQSVLLQQFADGVEEGYAATYAQSGRADVGVHAVRFTVPTPEPFTSFMKSRPQNTVRLNVGLVRIAFYGDDGPCSRAIETYLTSLAK